MTELQSKDELMNAFQKVISNKEDSQKALSNPSEILMKYGVKIPNPELTNQHLFSSVPQVRVHLIDAAKGEPHDLLGCESAKCIACKAGLNTGGVAAITALCLAWPEDMALVEPVAEFCGISVNAVKAVFAGLAAGGAVSVEAAISGLCKAMHAC